MRGQPTLPKTCSWTNLQMHLPPCSHVNLEQRWSQKTTEKAGFTCPGRAQNIKPLLPPFPPITGSQAHSVSCHFLHTCPTALPSSAGLDICPAFTAGNWLLLPWPELKRASIRGEKLRVGNQLRPLPSLPLPLTSEH